MKYVKNTSKIILSSLFSIHCYGMDTQKESGKTIEDMLKFFQAMNAAGGNDLLTSLRPPTNKNASNTAYFKAIEDGDLETVKKFYKNTPQFFKQQDWSGFNALHVAAENGRLNIVEFLMNNDKESLLQIPVGMGAYPIHMAAKKNYRSIVEFMCEKNNIIGAQKDSRTGGNILHMATANKATATVDYLMTNYPELLNEQDGSKNFPHQLALATGQKELAESMEARLKLFEKTKNVSVAGNSKSPEQLIKQPAQQQKNKIEAVSSQDPFYHDEGPDWTPFFRAIISGNLESVKKLYRNNPSIFKQPDYPGFNALHLAVNLGHLNIVEYLLEKDTSSRLQTISGGFFPIHVAAKHDHHTIVKILCEKNKNIIKQKETYTGRMANVLHVAAGNGAKETVNYLMTNYPELLNEQDKSTDFPHQTALREGYKELAASMVKARLKLSEKSKNVSVAANSQNPEQLTKQTAQQSNKEVQKKQPKNHKKSPITAQKKQQELVETKTVLPVQDAVPSQTLENPVPVIAQATPVYSKAGLKKINVEGVKAIYEKTLVKGEIYEANPNKDKMITHILKHQNEAKPAVKKEIPQIVLSDAERFANENPPMQDSLDTPLAIENTQKSPQTQKDLFKINLTKANKGDIEAKYQLGLAYLNAYGTPQDLEKAKESFAGIYETTDAPDALKIEAKKKLATIEQMSKVQNEDKARDKKQNKTIPLMERKMSKRHLKRADSLNISERSNASERSSEWGSLNSEIHSESENGQNLIIVNETPSSDGNLDHNQQINGMTIEYSNKGLKDIERLLTPEERDRMENEIAQNPTAKNAPIIQKSGGARKVRFAKDGTGKSFSIRIIYTYNPMKDKIVVLRVYDKSEEKSLPMKAKQEIKSFIKKNK